MRALVVGNGEPPSRALFDELMAAAPDRVLGADGGADVVRAYGVEPHAVVGDLDSVRQPRTATTTVRIDADDTGTDLNKVLAWAAEHGVTEAVLTGVTGRRTDHTLWNLSLLKTFAGRLRLHIADDHCWIYLVPDGGQVHFRVAVGQRLSLSPLDGPVRQVWTEGLLWSLAGEALVPGRRDGISNEVVTCPASVRVAGGDLLLVVQRQGAAGPVVFL